MSQTASPTGYAIYAANLLLSFHYFLIIFVNSAFLSAYVTDEKLSVLYIVGSLLSLVSFALFGKIIRSVGNYSLAVLLISLEALSLWGFITAPSAAVVITAFLIQLAVTPLLYLTLDIFLEKMTPGEGLTGRVRGAFLTVQNVALVLAPLLIALLLTDGNYFTVYAASLVFLFGTFMVLSGRLRTFGDPRYHAASLRESAAYVLRQKNLFHVTMGQLLLRFFYAWMAIYTPLYLYRNIGFSWQEIGIMFAIMLLPFLLLEWPLGKLADTRLGEKEIMAAGFAIMALSVAFVPFITAAAFMPWVALLFCTRIGASAVEIASETYFFKQVNGELADAISLFRATRPATYVAATLVALISLQFLPLQWTFLVLAVCMLSGIYFALSLKDTR